MQTYIHICVNVDEYCIVRVCLSFWCFFWWQFPWSQLCMFHLQTDRRSPMMLHYSPWAASVKEESLPNGVKQANWWLVHMKSTLSPENWWLVHMTFPLKMAPFWGTLRSFFGENPWSFRFERQASTPLVPGWTSAWPLSPPVPKWVENASISTEPQLNKRFQWSHGVLAIIFFKQLRVL